jgi:hypothetical protein
MESCNQGLGIGTRFFFKYEEVVVNPEDNVSFIATLEAATLGVENGANIYNTFNFKADKATTTMSELKISTVLALPLFN